MNYKSVSLLSMLFLIVSASQSSLEGTTPDDQLPFWMQDPSPERPQERLLDEWGKERVTKRRLAVFSSMTQPRPVTPEASGPTHTPTHKDVQPRSIPRRRGSRGGVKHRTKRMAKTAESRKHTLSPAIGVSIVKTFETVVKAKEILQRNPFYALTLSDDKGSDS
jgi:hypothetical protein